MFHYRNRGFDLDFDTNLITGHIDFLQIRNGFVHILDFKPEARKEKHAKSLLITKQHDPLTAPLKAASAAILFFS